MCSETRLSVKAIEFGRETEEPSGGKKVSSTSPDATAHGQVELYGGSTTQMLARGRSRRPEMNVLCVSTRLVQLWCRD